MNKKQYSIIANKLFKSPLHVKAVESVVFDNISAYCAENLHGLVRGTLSRKVNKYLDEVEYIRSIKLVK